MNTTKKLIGRGAFTKAYLLESGKVWLDSCDPIKECMALGWFPDSELFPEVQMADNGYLMERYEKPRSLKNTLEPRQYELYKALRELSVSCTNQHLRHSMWHAEFDTLPDCFEEEREALKEALDACANYGSDIQFEISPRNVAVKDGKLILLDCFFAVSKLDEVRSGRSR